MAMKTTQGHAQTMVNNMMGVMVELKISKPIPAPEGLLDNDNEYVKADVSMKPRKITHML